MIYDREPEFFDDKTLADEDVPALIAENERFRATVARVAEHTNRKRFDGKCGYCDEDCCGPIREMVLEQPGASVL